MKFKIKLPKNSIVVLIATQLFPFVVFVIINLIFILKSDGKLISKFTDIQEDPTIEITSPQNWSWKLPLEYTSEFIVSDPNNDINLSSIKVNVITPNLRGTQFIHYYTYENNKENFSIEKHNSRYNIKFTPSELPMDDTVLWYYEVSDNAVNISSKFYYTSTTYKLSDLLLSIPARMFVFFIIYAGVFGIKINYPKYGFVYDSINKKPISCAIVRLYQNQKLKGTAVTNNAGFFQMNPPKGKYYIIVKHPEYTFPSEKLKNLKSDGEMRNLYFGKVFSLSGNESIRLCIPLDKIGDKRKLNIIVKMNQQLLDKMVSINIILLTILIIANFYYVSIGTWNLDFETVSNVIYALIIISAQISLSYRSKNIKGKIVDTNKKPIAGVKLILLDSEFKQLKDSTVTDEKGKYLFIVPKGDYTIVPIHNDYELVSKKPYLIDGRKGIRKKIKELSVLTPKIVMEKKNSI